MRKPLSQLPLDFGGEEQNPSPLPDARENGVQQGSQYLATAGVGVRVKAYKQSEIANPATTIASEVQPTPVQKVQPLSASEIQPLPASEVLPVPVAEAPSTPTPEEQPAPAPKSRPLRDSPAGARPVVKPSKRGRKSLKQVGAEADLIEIPADDVLFSKQYYTMGEVSEMFKVNQSLLRYWETEFDILQPRKNKKGDRYFRPVDIKNLHLIYHLLRQKKYTIEGAKEFLRNNKKAKERFEVIERLQQIRNFLQEWKAQL
jgi:DNA-binding transcriptional MerR regulator